MTPQINNLKGALYLEKNRLQIYAPAKQAVLVFDIPPAIAHDIEIFNKPEFGSQLTNFLKTNAVPPTDFVLILAQNVLFEKDFTPANPDEQKKFLDSVPFESVSTKEFPLPNGVRIVAANADFYSSVDDVLRENGSTMEAVIPYFTVSPQMNGLDQASLAIVLAQYNQLKKGSLIPTKEPELVITNPEAERKAEAKKKDNKTLVYSIPVFVLLIGVLGFMLLRPASQPVTPGTRAASPSAALNQPTPVVPTVPQNSATDSASLAKAKVTIQITYDSSLATQAQALKDRLLQDGYSTIQLSDGGTVQSPKPIMLISPGLSIDLKNDLTDIMKHAIQDLIIQEDSNITFNVVITIGR